MKANTYRVLHVEDNPADVRIMEKIIGKMKVPVNLTTKNDGAEAIDFLTSVLATPDTAGLPDLVILDLNLPIKDGREVLRFIKTNHKSVHIPVIVLTSSESARDIDESYRSHANCYLVKPMNMEDFFEIGRQIEQFWLGINYLSKINW